MMKAENQTLADRFAAVTGAGDGIGRAIALRLASLGASVAVTDRDLGKAQDTALLIGQTGGTAITAELDVTQGAMIARTVQRITGEFGRIDLWYSNAGVSSMKRFVEVSEADWNFNVDVNAKGAFFCGQAAARQMLAQTRREDGLRGKIISIASVAGKSGKAAFLSHYIASKFAVVGMTQAMASELSPEGVTVNAVCPAMCAPRCSSARSTGKRRCAASHPKRSRISISRIPHSDGWRRRRMSPASSASSPRRRPTS
jgi:meso-butanediol dehydrogenase/(S,S)-butanediol dehydrogenase/diacetyl reductase